MQHGNLSSKLLLSSGRDNVKTDREASLGESDRPGLSSPTVEGVRTETDSCVPDPGWKLKHGPCLNTHSLPRVSEGGNRAPERENNSASNSSLTHLYKELLEHILIMNKNIHSVRKLTPSSETGNISSAGSMTQM